MATYKQRFDFVSGSGSKTFRDRLLIALPIAALSVQGESDQGTGTKRDKRGILAKRVLDDPRRELEHFLLALAGSQNLAIVQDSDAGDTALLAQLLAIWSDMAGVHDSDT